MRGKHNSTPIEELVKQAKHLARDGVKELIKNIHYWKDAPLWDKDKIKKATKIWFDNLK